MEDREIQEPAHVYHAFCLGRAEAPRVGQHKTLEKLRKFLNQYVFGPAGNVILLFG